MQGNSGSVSSQAKNIKISNDYYYYRYYYFLHIYFNDLIRRKYLTFITNE